MKSTPLHPHTHALKTYSHPAYSSTARHQRSCCVIYALKQNRRADYWPRIQTSAAKPSAKILQRVHFHHTKVQKLPKCGRMKFTLMYVPRLSNQEHSSCSVHSFPHIMMPDNMLQYLLDMDIYTTVKTGEITYTPKHNFPTDTQTAHTTATESRLKPPCSLCWYIQAPRLYATRLQNRFRF